MAFGHHAHPGSYMRLLGVTEDPRCKSTSGWDSRGVDNTPAGDYSINTPNLVVTCGPFCTVRIVATS
jgi:hypothetical protein